MSKFCENCGAELKDTDNVCSNCGTPVENAEPKDVKVEESTNVTETVNTNTTASNAKPEKKNNTKLYAIIGGIAALVIILIVIIAIACSGGYKKPIDNFFKGMQTGNAKTVLKAFPDVMKDDLEDTIDDDAMDTVKESLEDEFGKNVKITYKILDKEKIDKDDLKELQDNLEEEYDDAKKSKVKVSAGYKLTVKANIKGKDDSDSDSLTINVYKIGGKWCLANSSLSSLF